MKVALLAVLGVVAGVALSITAAAGAFTAHADSSSVGAAAPSLRSDLAVTKNVPCSNNRRQPGSPKVVHRFRAVAAVSCVYPFRTYPHGGEWEVRVRRVAVGSVTRLQRYFEQPSGGHLPKGEICAAPYVVTLVPVFVDAQGHWLLPLTPRGACGEPLAGGPPQVRWHVVSVHKIKLIVTAKALAANCPMKVGNTVAWAGPQEATSGGPLFDRTPKKVRVCIFRTSPNNVAVGYFVRGFRLDAARTRRLLGALTGPGPKPGCPKQRDFAEVGNGPQSGVGVELGGCYRVERPDRTSGTANPAVVRAILGR
jgi:hypothetical protein